MASSHSKLYIHHVSAVNGWQSLILPEFEEDLYKYIAGIIRKLGQSPIAINGMPDHIHIAARLTSSISPAKFVQKVKANSSKWINQEGVLPGRFSWQKGGGNFSFGERALPRVKRYIENQKAHHARVSPVKEYAGLLVEHGIEPQPEYSLQFLPDSYPGF